MPDRITPYEDGGKVDERIDEIVITAPDGVHLEMMDFDRAWMRIGKKIFWIEVRKRSLFVRHTEEWD